MFILAIKLDDFADDWNPYGYDDEFDRKVDGIEFFMATLKDDVESILEWLNGIVSECECWDDHKYDKFKDKANELIKEVKEWVSR